MRIFKELGIEHSVVDVRKPSPKTLDIGWNESFRQLRDYQIEAVEAAIKRTRGIVRLPTGSGKMLVAARIIQQLGRKATLFVVTAEALKDTYEELCHVLQNVSIGAWSGKKKTIGDVTVATVQSLYEKNRKGSAELLQHYLESDVIIFDEVHTTGANEYYALAKMSDARYKFGQSGTPFRGDGKDILLQAATGRIIYKQTTKDLQDKGYLAKSHVIFYNSKMPSDHTEESLAELTPHERYRATIIENDRRNALAKAVFNKYRDKPTLVIVKNEQHLKYIAEYFQIPLVYGKSSKGYREAVQNQLRSGEIWAVVATKVYDQSVNLPSLKVAINLAGHSPKNAQIQRLGRILRLHEDNDALFIDFRDVFDASALSHSINRIDYLREEGHEVEIADFDGKVVYDSKLEDIRKYRPVKKDIEDDENYLSGDLDEEEDGFDFL